MLLFEPFLTGVVTLIYVFETLVGVTDVPPIVKLLKLARFFGNPVPMIVISVNPSGVPVLGVIEVIVKSIVSAVTAASIFEKPIFS